MQKEILTKEKCKIDLMEATKDSLVLWVELPILIAIIFVLLEMLAWLQFGNTGAPRWSFPAATVLLSILPLSMAAVLFFRYRKNAKRRRKIQDGAFRIEQAVLIRSRQDADAPTEIGDRGGRYDHGRDLLEFSGGGRYTIRIMDYYKWSKLCPMSADGVFNTALIGDTFYLVIYNGDGETQPAMVYNTKLFELKEEDVR